MTIPNHPGPCWTTASFGTVAEASAAEYSALGEHLELCTRLTGRLFAVQRRAQSVQGFVVARLVTTTLAAGLLIGAVLLLL